MVAVTPRMVGPDVIWLCLRGIDKNQRNKTADASSEYVHNRNQRDVKGSAGRVEPVVTELDLNVDDEANRGADD